VLIGHGRKQARVLCGHTLQCERQTKKKNEDTLFGGRHSIYGRHRKETSTIRSTNKQVYIPSTPTNIILVQGDRNVRHISDLKAGDRLKYNSGEVVSIIGIKSAPSDNHHWTTKEEKHARVVPLRRSGKSHEKVVKLTGAQVRGAKLEVIPPRLTCRMCGTNLNQSDAFMMCSNGALCIMNTHANWSNIACCAAQDCASKGMSGDECTWCYVHKQQVAMRQSEICKHLNLSSPESANYGNFTTARLGGSGFLIRVMKPVKGCKNTKSATFSKGVPLRDEELSTVNIDVLLQKYRPYPCPQYSVFIVDCTTQRHEVASIVHVDTGDKVSSNEIETVYNNGKQFIQKARLCGAKRAGLFAWDDVLRYISAPNEYTSLAEQPHSFYPILGKSVWTGDIGYLSRHEGKWKHSQHLANTATFMGYVLRGSGLENLRTRCVEANNLYKYACEKRDFLLKYFEEHNMNSSAHCDVTRKKLNSMATTNQSAAPHIDCKNDCGKGHHGVLYLPPVK